MSRARHGLYMVGREDAGGVMVPVGRDDRWVYGVLWSPDEPVPSTPIDEILANAPVREDDYYAVPAVLD